MAKSSRGRGRKRRQVDWVVNYECYGAIYNIPNAAYAMIPLVIPEREAAYVDPTLAVPYPRHYWPEQDSGQEVYAVRGEMEVIPQGTWAAGSFFRLMTRIVKKPMEYGTAFNAILDGSYSLADDNFANERFLWQHLNSHQYTLGGVVEVQRVHWKGIQKLDPDEGLFLIAENTTGFTQGVQLQCWLRSLVRANG